LPGGYPARVELALRLEPLIAAKAKEDRKRKPGVVVQKSSQQTEDRKTRAQLARAAGVSHDTIHKAKVILARQAKADKKRKPGCQRAQGTVNKRGKRRHPPPRTRAGLLTV